MTAPTQSPAPRLCADPSCGAELPVDAHHLRLYCRGGACARSKVGGRWGTVTVEPDFYETLRAHCSRRGLSMRLVVEGVVESAMAEAQQ